MTFASAHAQVSAVPASGSWAIVPGLVEFDSLGLDLTVSQAADGNRELRPVVTADCELADGRLNAAFDLAAHSWLCCLQDDSSIDIQGLFEDKLQLRGVLPPDVPAEFEITRFEIRGDATAGTHAVDVATSLNWPLTIGSTTLTLVGFFVTLAYAGDGGPAGTLGGTMGIGPVTVTVTAAYDQAGLTFEVAAYDLPLTQLVADILGDERLADELPEVNFALLDLAVTPGTGAFSVRARTDSVCRRAGAASSDRDDSGTAPTVRRTLTKAQASAPFWSSSGGLCPVHSSGRNPRNLRGVPPISPALSRIVVTTSRGPDRCANPVCGPRNR